MKGNRLKNQGYFVSRLKNSGYAVLKLKLKYSEVDPRAWTIVINPKSSNVFCTCYINANNNNLKESSYGEVYFELYDGGQYLPKKIKISTSSIEVFLTYLSEYGVVGDNTTK